MSALKPSIERRITDALLARVKGDANLARPDGLDDFTTDKDRSIAAMPSKQARLSLYTLKQNEPTRTGNERRPIQLGRMLQLEIRVLVRGDDDTLDAFRQWITLCCGSAGTLKTDEYPEGLALSVREGESATDLVADSGGSVLAYMSRWWVEFTTLPADLTSTGRRLE